MVKFILLTLGLCTSAFADGMMTRFESAHSIALKGTITQGKIITDTESVWQIRDEIKQQLLYTIGAFNEEDAVADTNQTKISVGEITTLPNGYFEVTYSAELLVAWPRESRFPESFELVMPARGDWVGTSKFFQKYGNENSREKCLTGSAHDVTVGIFWYYYRPHAWGCKLRDRSEDDTSLVRRFDIHFEESDQNTAGKYPEYDKVWEDGKLVITAIFGMNKAEAGRNDVGIRAYDEIYRKLVAEFGQPTWKSTEFPSSGPGFDNKHVEIKFDSDHGEVDVALFLVEGIRSVGQKFRDAYNKRTLVSDFVSYSGHSGLGANIRALARMGQFAQDQYQLYLVNGCDTFAYVDSSLKDAHKLVNPTYNASKFLDIITNAMPSYFVYNAKSNMAVISALAKKTKTFREILNNFDRSQRAVVNGEEDNRYPGSFY